MKLSIETNLYNLLNNGEYDNWSTIPYCEVTDSHYDEARELFNDHARELIERLKDKRYRLTRRKPSFHPFFKHIGYRGKFTTTNGDEIPFKIRLRIEA